jgi:hypothetical protein
MHNSFDTENCNVTTESQVKCWFRRVCVEDGKDKTLHGEGISILDFNQI